MTLGSTQPLKERTTRNPFGGKGWLAQGWKPKCQLRVDCPGNVGALMSRNPLGLCVFLQG
jgi:hypothetical protein